MEKTHSATTSDLIARIKAYQQRAPSPSQPLTYRDEKGNLVFIPRSKVFVFGSNYPGVHGRGAAAFAVKHFDAEYGVGTGRTGRSYALPTKRNPKLRLTLLEIAEHVKEFLDYARWNPEDEFFVTKIGCGLAGYTEEVIAPLFQDAPLNCQLPEGWRVAQDTEQDDATRSSEASDSVLPQAGGGCGVQRPTTGEEGNEGSVRDYDWSEVEATDENSTVQGDVSGSSDGTHEVTSEGSVDETG